MRERQAIGSKKMKKKREKERREKRREQGRTRGVFLSSFRL
jgi:hypothetical protein